MHIELWQVNKNKALDMSGALGAPNKFINQFLDRVDSENFISTMQELLRTKDHVQLKISVEKVTITESKNK